jgi:hypothetical protein
MIKLSKLLEGKMKFLTRKPNKETPEDIEISASPEHDFFGFVVKMKEDYPWLVEPYLGSEANIGQTEAIDGTPIEERRTALRKLLENYFHAPSRDFEELSKVLRSYLLKEGFLITDLDYKDGGDCKGYREYLATKGDRNAHETMIVTTLSNYRFPARLSRSMFSDFIPRDKDELEDQSENHQRLISLTGDEKLAFPIPMSVVERIKLKKVSTKNYDSQVSGAINLARDFLKNRNWKVYDYK